MIMVVFGAPNIIYQSKEGESWIYGEKNNMYALNFTFTKIKISLAIMIFSSIAQHILRISGKQHKTPGERLPIFGYGYKRKNI